jgi:hypothetical protein
MKHLPGIAAAFLLVVATSACGASAGARPTVAAHPTPTSSTPTTVHKLNPYYDAGNTILITATGFEPRVLIATAKVPVRFVNRTSTAQRVQFEHDHFADGQLVHSGSIAPGASWTYTFPSWESATYHSTIKPALRGQIQIQPPAEP